MVHAPAPLDLRVIEEFCNTAVLLGGTDELGSLARARTWLRKGGWKRVGGQPELQAMRDERESIRAFLVDRSDAEARRQLNELIERYPPSPHVDAEGNLAFVRDSRPLCVTGAAISALLLHGLSSTGRRLKACAAPECRFVFYDHSRSRTGTWCDMNVCGARHKMREYRQRAGRSRQGEPKGEEAM